MRAVAFRAAPMRAVAFFAVSGELTIRRCALWRSLL